MFFESQRGIKEIIEILNLAGDFFQDFFQDLLILRCFFPS